MQIELQSITKSFRDSPVLRGIGLYVESGHMVSLLGHSGCGKTTLLRILAGLIEPDEGEVLFGGKPVQTVPAHQRQAAMVFQSYAIFPHLTVAENIAYGLKARNVPRAERDERVREILDKVKLGGLASRMPSQLSGGQKQRVGLARALVVRPLLLLMDEPLSNLDAGSRIEMREEIRLLQREYGMTTIYVTHDQEEALAVSDKVALMSEGRIRQYDTPYALYNQPCDIEVARFVGRSNILDASLDGLSQAPCLTVGGERLVLPDLLRGVTERGAAKLSFRPEAEAELLPIAAAQEEGLTCSLQLASFIGTHWQLRLRLKDGQEIELRVPPSHPVVSSPPDKHWRLRLAGPGLHLFKGQDGREILA